MRTTKKKKQQPPVTQGIDTIIPTSQATPPTTTAPTSAKPGGSRQPRGKGTVVNFQSVKKLYLQLTFCEKQSIDHCLSFLFVVFIC